MMTMMMIYRLWSQQVIASKFVVLCAIWCITIDALLIEAAEAMSMVIEE